MLWIFRKLVVIHWKNKYVILISRRESESRTMFFFQLNLFNNIKVLFTNKPLLIVLNKIDIKRLDELPEDKKVN